MAAGRGGYTRPRPDGSGVRTRRLAPMLLVVCVGLALAPAGSSAEARTPRLLRPNLWVLSPSGFVVRERDGRRLLRFATTIVNVGVGPLEVRPKIQDCNGDGDTSDDRTAYQRLYRDDDADGQFTRGVDRSFATRKVGCFEYDSSHGHWHFEDFARYEVRKLGSGALVAFTAKVGFCLSDDKQTYAGIPGSPRRAYYRPCSQGSTQGLSLGWSDIYAADLPGQVIDITGLRDGRYCFVAVTDPDDRLAEKDDADNATSQAIRLKGRAVVPLSIRC